MRRLVLGILTCLVLCAPALASDAQDELYDAAGRGGGGGRPCPTRRGTSSATWAWTTRWSRRACSPGWRTRLGQARLALAPGGGRGGKARGHCAALLRGHGLHGRLHGAVRRPRGLPRRLGGGVFGRGELHRRGVAALDDLQTFSRALLPSLTAAAAAGGAVTSAAAKYAARRSSWTYS